MMIKEEMTVKVRKWMWQAWVVLMLIAAGYYPAIAFAQEVVLIGNKSIPENVLNSDDIKNIFLGRKTRWSNDTKIQFVILKRGDIHEKFLKDYIGKTDSQYTTYWKKMVFTGKGRSPQAFESAQALVEFVASTPYAIGYAPASVTNDTVKIIKIR